ncbi:hypothetical protein HMPREF9554_00819 [Treponema phagedenis F0421]|nr:hypothetical protein HMPREF9554_00819 [Treponema phagedenis F0421]
MLRIKGRLPLKPRITVAAGAEPFSFILRMQGATAPLHPAARRNVGIPNDVLPDTLLQTGKTRRRSKTLCKASPIVQSKFPFFPLGLPSCFQHCLGLCPKNPS